MLPQFSDDGIKAVSILGNLTNFQDTKERVMKISWATGMFYDKTIDYRISGGKAFSSTGSSVGDALKRFFYRLARGNVSVTGQN